MEQRDFRRSPSPTSTMMKRQIIHGANQRSPPYTEEQEVVLRTGEPGVDRSQSVWRRKTSPSKIRQDHPEEGGSWSTFPGTETLRPRNSTGSRTRSQVDVCGHRVDLAQLLFWTVLSLGACTFIGGMLYQGSSTRELDNALVLDQLEQGNFLSLQQLRSNGEVSVGDPHGSLGSLRRRLKQQIYLDTFYERSLPTRPARIALVSGDLMLSPENIYSLTLGTAFANMGYHIEVVSLFGGSLTESWGSQQIPVNIVNSTSVISLDWLRYDAVLSFGMDSSFFISRLSVEPFANTPLVWVIHDDCKEMKKLRKIGKSTNDSTADHLHHRWETLVDRADAVIAPSVSHQRSLQSIFKNFRPILLPGTPAWVWRASAFAMNTSQAEARQRLGLKALTPSTPVLTVVGPVLKSRRAIQEETCKEQMVVLKALHQMMLSESRKLWWRRGPSSEGSLTSLHVILLLSNETLCGSQTKALGASLSAVNVSLTIVEANQEACSWERLDALQASDVVIYAEGKKKSQSSAAQGLPPVLVEALALRKLVVAPKTRGILPQIQEGRNGVLYEPRRHGPIMTALSKALKMPTNETEAMKLAGRETAVAWGSKTAVEGVEKILRALLGTAHMSALSLPWLVDDLQWKQGWVWGIHSQQSTAKSDGGEVDTSSRWGGSEGGSTNMELSPPGNMHMEDTSSTAIDKSGVKSFLEGSKDPATAEDSDGVASLAARALLSNDFDSKVATPKSANDEVALVPAVKSFSDLRQQSENLKGQSAPSGGPDVSDDLDVVLRSSQSPEDSSAADEKAKLLQGSMVDELEKLWTTESSLREKAEKRKKKTSPDVLELPDLLIDGALPDLREEDSPDALEDPQEIIEAELLADRKEYPVATLDDMKLAVRRLEKDAAIIHLEQDEGLVERIGQPICIYEPYEGTGTWPLLHSWHPLYRAISMDQQGRRGPEFDDVDAWERLPLMRSKYYKGVLGELGAMLSIGYHMDHVHYQRWIGFQSWRATASGAALSEQALEALVTLLEEENDLHDTVIFWVSSSSNFSLPADLSEAEVFSTLSTHVAQELSEIEDVEGNTTPPGAHANSTEANSTTNLGSSTRVNMTVDALLSGPPLTKLEDPASLCEHDGCGPNATGAAGEGLVGGPGWGKALRGRRIWKAIKGTMQTARKRLRRHLGERTQLLGWHKVESQGTGAGTASKANTDGKTRPSVFAFDAVSEKADPHPLSLDGDARAALTDADVKAEVENADDDVLIELGLVDKADLSNKRHTAQKAGGGTAERLTPTPYTEARTEAAALPNVEDRTRASRTSVDALKLGTEASASEEDGTLEGALKRARSGTLSEQQFVKLLLRRETLQSSKSGLKSFNQAVLSGGLSGEAGQRHKEQAHSDNEDEDGDLWKECNKANRGYCRSAYLAAFRLMYGLPPNWSALPPMPSDGGAWSAMHSWAMPTSSFQQFIMFARMFIDALDSRFFHDHYTRGICPLANNALETQQCYCQILEPLVNIWAYHSGKRLLYMDPKTGAIAEQHPLEERQGRDRRMWLAWFNKYILRAMTEDRAEDWDDTVGANSIVRMRWLWPHTGDVTWRGSQARERLMKLQLKVERDKKKSEKLKKMRLHYNQKPLSRQKKKNPKKQDTIVPALSTPAGGTPS